MKHFFLLIIIFSLFISCSDSGKDCFKSAGEIDSLNIEVQDFNIINVSDIFNIYLQKGNEYSVKIRTNSTLLQNVKIEQNDTILSISDQNKCYFSRNKDISIDIFITAPNLREINLYNASTVKSLNTLEYERFMFRAYGKLAFCDLSVDCSDHFFLQLWDITGEYSISGKCTFFDVLDHGKNTIHAYDLSSDYAIIEQRSTGDMELTVNKKLKVELYCIGNVLFRGNPAIDSSIIGQGKIINAN